METTQLARPILEQSRTLGDEESLTNPSPDDCRTAFRCSCIQSILGESRGSRVVAGDEMLRVFRCANMLLVLHLAHHASVDRRRSPRRRWSLFRERWQHGYDSGHNRRGDLRGQEGTAVQVSPGGRHLASAPPKAHCSRCSSLIPREDHGLYECPPYVYPIANEPEADAAELFSSFPS